MTGRMYEYEKGSIMDAEVMVKMFYYQVKDEHGMIFSIILNEPTKTN